ncbi:uncharacterized protein LOC100183185 [Ciona intestinalis]
MKKPKPTIVYCELRRPADEIINISSQNGAEGVVTRMLPKSHVSHVILNANVSEERFLGMKVSTENKMLKKNNELHEHFMNTFMRRLERKQQRWMKEDNYVSKNFQLTLTPRHHVTERQPIGELLLPTPPKAQVLYKPAKYPYMTMRGGGEQHVSVLPRIRTVPTSQSRHDTSQSIKRVQQVNEPLTSPVRTTWGETTNQRAETASTGLTRMTTGHVRKPAMRNHDSRFTELLSWLSPVDARKGKMFRRPREHKVMFGVTQTSY